MENNVVHDYHIGNNLLLNNWTMCYDEEFTTATSIKNLINQCPIGDDIYYFVGAKSTNNSLLAYLGVH